MHNSAIPFPQCYTVSTISYYAVLVSAYLNSRFVEIKPKSLSLSEHYL